MSTTQVTTWASDLTQLGPIYPFVGAETFLWIAGIAFWLGFHIIQVRREQPEIEAAIAAAKSSGDLDKRLG